MVELKKILNFIIYILKILIYFDTKFIKLNPNISKPSCSGISGGGEGGEGGEEGGEEEKDSTDKAAEEAGDAGLAFWFTYIKEIVMGVLKWFGEKVTKLLGMLLFASIAPIIPFFVSMAGLFGVVKFFMYKLRRF